MQNKSFIEMALEKDNLIVSFSIIVVVFIAYVLRRVGMPIISALSVSFVGILTIKDRLVFFNLNSGQSSTNL